MTPSELKLDLFRKLDSLDNVKVRKLYGTLLNLFSENETYEEWESLSNQDQQKILDSEKQYFQGKYKKHSEVMSKIQ
ncbi:MAG TPA: hypothetical protein DCF44_00135 [Chitinophagaceae bacterium]|nr:hypothetical protein [Chitinophagaceae bacterium]